MDHVPVPGRNHRHLGIQQIFIHLVYGGGGSCSSGRYHHCPWLQFKNLPSSISVEFYLFSIFSLLAEKPPHDLFILGEKIAASMLNSHTLAFEIIRIFDVQHQKLIDFLIR